MPELPEVETVVRSLRPDLAGAMLRRLDVLDGLLLPLPLDALRDRAIEGVERVGKSIVMPLTRPGAPAVWLGVHLRMTGRLVWERHVDAGDMARVRARFQLDGDDLLFVDMRRFGTLRCTAHREQAGPRGVDPLSRGLTTRRLRRLLGASRQGLKAWLLRQDRLAGIGNIYASEILHAARLHPERSAGSLDEREAARLLAATKRVLRAAIRAGGTTFSDYRDSRGAPGAYQSRLKVYGREGERCRACRAEILRTVTQGRSTFHCPRCQHA